MSGSTRGEGVVLSDRFPSYSTCGEPSAAARSLIPPPHNHQVVSTMGMTIEPFRPETKNGLLHGQGSCDANGGLAAML